MNYNEYDLSLSLSAIRIKASLKYPHLKPTHSFSKQIYHQLIALQPTEKLENTHTIHIYD